MAGTSARSARTMRVLDASFAEQLESMATDEVRSRRDQTLAERDYQSYLRRLIQARQDLLAQEKARRASGAPPPPLLERLIAVLALGPQGGSRGEALRLQIPPEDIDEAERRLGEVLGEARLVEPEALSEEDLERSLAALTAAEHEISSERAAVFRVHDRLQDELKRRYRVDPDAIPTAL